MNFDTAKSSNNASKTSSNGDSTKSLARYVDRIQRSLERSEKSKNKILAKIETLRLKVEAEADNISPERQLNMLLKVSDLVCRLERNRIKMLDLIIKCH